MTEMENIRQIVGEYTIEYLCRDLLRSLLSAYYCILHDYHFRSKFVSPDIDEAAVFKEYLDMYKVHDIKIATFIKIILKISKFGNIQTVLETVYGSKSSEVQLYKKAFLLMNVTFAFQQDESFLDQCVNDSELKRLITDNEKYYPNTVGR